MKIFGWEAPFNISFTWVPGVSKNDPVVPFQFQSLRAPKTNWAHYALVLLVMGLGLAVLFLMGLNLADPISR